MNATVSVMISSGNVLGPPGIKPLPKLILSSMTPYDTTKPWWVMMSHITGISDNYPTMHHFVTEICTDCCYKMVHCGIWDWCVVVYGTGHHGFVNLVSLQWRHNERDGVSNHQRLDYLLNCLFRRRSKKTSKIRVTGLCKGNSSVAVEFPAQRASDAENVSIWWRHHIFSFAGWRRT